MIDTKIKTTPSCSPRQAGSKHVLFDFERSNWKFDHRSRSGQGQKLTQVKCTCTSKRLDEPSRSAPFARLYLHPVPTNWLKTDCDLIWPQVTSPDPYRQLHPDVHRCGDCPWSWWNFVVSIGLCETRSIFIFSHRLTMWRSRNWPDLRSPG